MMTNERPDSQYNWMLFLQTYYAFWIWAIIATPFLLLAAFCFSQFLNGAPEPQWWINLEAELGITW
jgi:hypothetical protein